MKSNATLYKEIDKTEFKPGGEVIITTADNNFIAHFEDRIIRVTANWGVELRDIRINNIQHKKRYHNAGEPNFSTYKLEFPPQFSDQKVKLCFYEIVNDMDKFYKAEAEYTTVSFKTEDSYLSYSTSMKINEIYELSTFESKLSEVQIKKSSQPNTYDMVFPKTIADKKIFWFYIINRQYQAAFESLTAQFPSTNDASIDFNSYQESDWRPESIKHKFEVILSAENPLDTKLSALLKVLGALISTQYYSVSINTVAELLCKPANIKLLYAVLNKQLRSDYKLYDVLELLKKTLFKYHAIIDWYIDNSKSQEIQFWTYINDDSLIQNWNNRITYLNSIHFQALNGTTISSIGNGHFHRMRFPQHIPENEKLLWFYNIVYQKDGDNVLGLTENINENLETTTPVPFGNENPVNLQDRATIKFKSETANWHRYALHRIDALSFLEINLNLIEIKSSNASNTYVVAFPEEIASQKEFWLHIINAQYQKAFESLAALYTQIQPQKYSNNFSSNVLDYFRQATSFDDMQTRLEMLMSSQMNLDTKFKYLLNVLHLFSHCKSGYINFLMNATLEQLSKPDHIQILHKLLNTEFPSNHPFNHIYNSLKESFYKYYTIIDWYIDYTKKHEVICWTHTEASSLAQEWKVRSVSLNMKITICSLENGHMHRFIFPTAVSEREKIRFFQYITRLPEKIVNKHSRTYSIDNNNNNNDNDDNIVQKAISNFRAQSMFSNNPHTIVTQHSMNNSINNNNNNNPDIVQTTISNFLAQNVSFNNSQNRKRPNETDLSEDIATTTKQPKLNVTQQTFFAPIASPPKPQTMRTGNVELADDPYVFEQSLEEFDPSDWVDKPSNPEFS